MPLLINVQSEDSNGDVITDSSGNPAGNMVIAGEKNVITAVSGQIKSHIMVPTDAALTGAEAANKIWVGQCKAYRIKAAAAIAATNGIVHASSTTASDGAALAGVVNTLDGEFTTGTGAASTGGVVQTLGEEVGSWILWDGENTIKTIACRLSVGITPAQVILETIE